MKGFDMKYLVKAAATLLYSSLLLSGTGNYNESKHFKSF